MRYGINPFTGRLTAKPGVFIDPILAIPGLVHYTAAWYPTSYLNASADPVTDGEAVATVLDQSTADNDLTQTTGLDRPLWDVAGGPNGLPAMMFDGLGDNMSIPTLTYGAGSHSIFAVVKYITPDTYGARVFSFKADSSVYTIVDGSFEFYQGGGGTVGLGGISSDWNIVELHTESDIGMGAINGTETSLGALPVIPDLPLALAAETSAGTNSSNLLCAALVCATRLSSADIAIVRNELSLRTGIPIA